MTQDKDEIKTLSKWGNKTEGILTLELSLNLQAPKNCTLKY